MASISNVKNGTRMIQFVNSDGDRKTIRLGKTSLRAAETVKPNVEHLVAAAISGHAIDDETARWVAKLEETLADRLAAVGLVPKRQESTLGPFIDGYIATRSDTKPNTLIVWRQTRRNLIEFFGADKPLRTITKGDADTWRLYLIEQGLAEDSTVRRRCGFAKQFLNVAVRHELISRNPFGDIGGTTVLAKRDREYFVSRGEADKVIDACPGFAMAAAVRPEPLRRPTMPVRASLAAMGMVSIGDTGECV